MMCQFGIYFRTGVTLIPSSPTTAISSWVSKSICTTPPLASTLDNCIGSIGVIPSLSASTDIALQKGETLKLQVDNIHPNVQLKVIKEGAANSKNSGNILNLQELKGAIESKIKEIFDSSNLKELKETGQLKEQLTLNLVQPINLPLNLPALSHIF